MLAPLLDNFNRANIFPLDGNWVNHPGGASAEIVSNHLESGNSPPASGSTTWNTVFNANCEAWAKSITVPTTDELGVYVRFDSTTGNARSGYEAGLNGSGTISLGRRDAGAWTLLDQASIGFQNGDGIGIRAVGSYITAWRYRAGVWTLQLEAIDSKYSNAGYIGMVFYTDADALQWDDFGGGSIPSYAAEVMTDSPAVYYRMDEQWIGSGNTFEGGSDGTTITVGNSGGLSGNACSDVIIGAGCVLEYDSGQARGGYSARFLMPATAAQTYLKWTETLGTGNCWYSIEYRKVNTPSGTFFQLLRIDESSPDGRAFGLSITNTGTIRCDDQASEVAALAGATAIPNNQWVRVELRLNQTAGEAEWWLYLNPDSNVADETKSTSGLDLGASALYEVMTGAIASVTNMNDDEWWVDNVRWTNVSKLGPTGTRFPQDSSGNGNHTTVVNGTPAYSQTGAILSDPSSTAITLDGSTEYFTAPDHATLDVGDVFTLEAWISREGVGSNDAIVSKDYEGPLLRVNTNNKLALSRAGVQEIVESTTTITDSLWHHVVATKNGATSKLYIDGVDVTGSVTNSTCTNNIWELVIGSSDQSFWHFPGRIDEVAVYPTALSAERIRAHYRAGKYYRPSTNVGVRM